MVRKLDGNDEPRFESRPEFDALQGRVVWRAGKSLWYTGLLLVAVIGGALTISGQNFLVFLITTAFVLCFGHSLGMHRRLIHNAYDCPLWLEHFMVWIGTLTGLGGPLAMIYTHDIRDWAQRQAVCHDYFAHRQGFWRDAWWQIHCDVELSAPPRLQLEERVENDKFYAFIERYWMQQQLIVAVILFVLGGMGVVGLGWVIWGVCVRVVVSITGHWLIGHFAHRTGQRDWHVEEAGVQGYNIDRFGWLAGLATFGESWHNNHHAFPGSARIGHKRSQPDPGWWMLRLMQKAGLVWNLHTPKSLHDGPGLRAINPAPYPSGE